MAVGLSSDRIGSKDTGPLASLYRTSAKQRRASGIQHAHSARLEVAGTWLNER
jgi:hypothetical protein